MSFVRPESLAWADLLVDVLYQVFPEALMPVWSPLKGSRVALAAKIPGPPGVEIAFAFTELGNLARIGLYSCTKSNQLWHQDEVTEFDNGAASLESMIAWLSVARATWEAKYRRSNLQYLKLDKSIEISSPGTRSVADVVSLPKDTAVVTLSEADKNAVWFLESPWTDSTRIMPRVKHFGLLSALALQNLAREARVDTEAMEVARRAKIPPRKSTRDLESLIQQTLSDAMTTKAILNTTQPYPDSDWDF